MTEKNSTLLYRLLFWLALSLFANGNAYPAVDMDVDVRGKYGFNDTVYMNYVRGKSPRPGLENACRRIDNTLFVQFLKCRKMSLLRSYAANENYSICVAKDQSEFMIFNTENECRDDYAVMVKSFSKDHQGKYGFDISDPAPHCKKLTGQDVKNLRNCVYAKKMKRYAAEQNHHKCPTLDGHGEYHIFKTKELCNQNLAEGKARIEKSFMGSYKKNYQGY